MDEPYDDLTRVNLEHLKNTKGWQNQFRIISQWGTFISSKPNIRIDENRIKGCEVAAWLRCTVEDQKIHFIFDSESRLINGLACILLVLVNNKTHEQLAQANLDATLEQLGIQRHLSPSRSNGFRALIQQVKIVSQNTRPC